MVTAIVSLGVLGLILGVGLVIANRYLQVKEDPLIEKVLELLPGANCGGCGYGGCQAFARAIVNEGKDVTLCAPSSETAVAEISKLLGREIITKTKKVAIVLCGGDQERAKQKFRYMGDLDCRSANSLGGGDKLCNFGCLGYGSCLKVCKFDAIKITPTGIAVIDPEKCTGCGKCIEVCPKGIIKLVPKDTPLHVLCSSPLKGKIVKEQCNVGCIGCKLCTKQSPLIVMEGDLAKVSYEEFEGKLQDSDFLKNKEKHIEEIFPEQTALVCPSQAIIDLRYYNCWDWITSLDARKRFEERVKKYKEEEKMKRAKAKGEEKDEKSAQGSSQ